MYSIGLKIKQLMNQQKVDAVTLAKRLGKSKQAVYDMLEKEDVNTALLRQLAEVFDVPITFFFTDEQDSLHNATAINNSVAAINSDVKVSGDVAVLKERIAMLEKIVEEKERLIQVLMTKI